jgi:hypothetical protein
MMEYEISRAEESALDLAILAAMEGWLDGTLTRALWRHPLEVIYCRLQALCKMGLIEYRDGKWRRLPFKAKREAGQARSAKEEKR